MNAKRRTGPLTAWAAVFLLFSPLRAETDYSRQIQSFREFAEQRIQSDPIPGLSIGFYKDGYWWADGFGYSDLENKVPAKAESAYRLASVTKPMTAVAILKLAEMGKLDLDAEVQTYVPYFPKKKWPVTIRALLGHLGAISHYRDYDQEGHFKDRKNTRQSIAVFEDFELVAEPWTRFNYSSYGFNLLGAVIEGASGQSYADFMREHVWGPLGMNSTRMDDPNALIPNRARGYRRGPDGKIINSEFVDISSRFAAGGTRSTVTDMLKFAKGVMDGTLLPKPYLDEMLVSMATKEGRATGYGMGWGIRSVNGRFTFSHSGGQAETATYLIAYPGLKMAIAVACNLEGGNRFPYIEALYNAITGEFYAPPAYTGSRPAEAFYRAMDEVFSAGFSYFDRKGETVSAASQSIDRAFAYFNGSVDPKELETNPEEALRKIRLGAHPAADRAFAVMGSYMAQRLAASLEAAQLDALHGGGPIEFFDAYLQLYRRDSGVPAPRRFAPATEQRLAVWRKDWARTWNSEVRDLIRSDAGPRQFEEIFAGAEVYPNLVDRFSDRVEALHMSGQTQQAGDTAVAAARLYPKSADAQLLAGIALLGHGDVKTASRYVKATAELSPSGAGSAGSLNAWAYRLKSVGQTEKGLRLLEMAVELHPKTANLYDSIGEFHLEMGRKDEALAWYEKALQIDPNLENAKRMLEKIRSKR